MHTNFFPLQAAKRDESDEAQKTLLLGVKKLELRTVQWPTRGGAGSYGQRLAGRSSAGNDAHE